MPEAIAKSAFVGSLMLGVVAAAGGIADAAKKL